VQGQNKPEEPKMGMIKIVYEKEYGEKKSGYSCLTLNDTQLVTSTEGHKLEILDINTFQVLKRVDNAGDKGSLVLDNKFALVADSFKDGITLLDLASGKPTAKIDLQGNFIAHAGLNLLATRSSREQVQKDKMHSVVVYDVAKQKVLNKWSSPNRNVPGVEAFSKSGMLGIDSGDVKTFLLWPPPYDKPPQRVDCGKTSRCMAFSPDERHLAIGIGNEERVELWNLQTKTRERVLVDNGEGRVYALTYSPDGQFLAAVGIGRHGYQITLWRTKDYTLIEQVSAHKEIVQNLVFFPDSKRFATAGADGLIKVWKIEPEK
jgi:WD40 repeat protein